MIFQKNIGTKITSLTQFIYFSGFLFLIFLAMAFSIRAPSVGYRNDPHARVPRETWQLASPSSLRTVFSTCLRPTLPFPSLFLPLITTVNALWPIGENQHHYRTPLLPTVYCIRRWSHQPNPPTPSPQFVENGGGTESTVSCAYLHAALQAAMCQTSEPNVAKATHISMTATPA